MWEMAEPQLNGRRMTPSEEASLFGSTFEKLSQDRRVKVLAAYRLIDESRKGNFDTIRLVRRGYLHLWSEDHDQAPGDAVKCFHAAVSLVVSAIGQDVKDGKIMLNPSFAAYLERKGLYPAPRDPDAE